MSNPFFEKVKAGSQNKIIQFFKYIILSLKIMLIVAGGHGGTRDK